MHKINVLVVPSDRTGVGAYRSINPHLMLEKMFPEEFKVEINFDPSSEGDKFWDSYHIVAFHRSIGPDMIKSLEIIKMLNKKGIITICDVDDHWSPTRDHPLYNIIIREGLAEKIKNNIAISKVVTTTTTVFADLIKPLHNNVQIFPNAVDSESEQFKRNPTKSDRMRFGWLGGSTHMNDLKLIDGTLQLLRPNMDKLQMVLCGFDARGENKIMDPRTGKVARVEPIEPSRSIWADYEKIFTDNYRTVSDAYRAKLMEYDENVDISHFQDEAYMRYWTLPITSFAKNYNNFDVSIVPLKDHIFNRAKSQLKVIEAGFHKKTIIASNIGPYSIDIIHGIKDGKMTDQGNGVLVNKDRNHRDWSKYMKKLIENPNWVSDMGERLYESVKNKYEIRKVTKDRAEFYKNLMK